jgi:hypothetical protein
LNTDKPHTPAATIRKVPILNGKENLGVISARDIVDDVASRIMEGQNRQVLEAHPVIVKVSLEITDNPFRH